MSSDCEAQSENFQARALVVTRQLGKVNPAKSEESHCPSAATVSVRQTGMLVRGNYALHPSTATNSYNCGNQQL